MLTSAGIGNHAVRPKNDRLFPLILIPDHDTHLHIYYLHGHIYESTEIIILMMLSFSH